MDEVNKLLSSFIREVYYPDWLANVILVKKANRKWRMCVDTNLNKTCPKDSFPLPKIDQLVDSTVRHKLLTFMDAFSGYNQIKMAEEDQEKIAFITSQGLYCYKVMPFSLKNAEATDQSISYSRKCSLDLRRGQETTPSLLRQPCFPEGRSQVPKKREDCICISSSFAQAETWAIELSQFDIEYHPKTAIKAQALADFIAEFTFPEEDSNSDKIERWTIQTDDLSTQKKGGARVVIITLEGEMLKYGVQLKFPATNNEAEYEGILTGLRVGKALEAKKIPRSKNMLADEIAKLASSKEGSMSYIDLKVEVPKHPSIEEVPTFVDARELVKKCDRCQRFGNVQQLPAETLITIASPWPFAQWGIDIVYPLPRGKGQVKFLLVAIDYFTKTTTRTPAGETPFRLTYSTEAVILVKMGISSVRQETFHEESNDDQLKINLDCLDKIRDEAFNRLTKYQQKMAEYYNKRVKLRRLEIGDLVLLKLTSATKDLAQGKLGPTWEGPYWVVHYSRQGRYNLETLDGQRLPRSWNTKHLKKYHQ
ncbi:uncharacterized protein LOC142621563 [Castanea sativa]|uniref:uncharacterized protein LOC142621563 n=1 Tax=Castanea sativa TaxID=21020 RepID=UPI003F64981C